MSDSVLDKYARKVDLPPGIASEPDSVDDLGAFGWLRGVKERALMLELRMRTGNIVAIGYAWLERVEFNPSEGITLRLSGKEIKIRGRNLNSEVRPLVRLFDGIVRQRVPWVQEADEPTLLEAPRGTVIVDRIEIP